MKNQIIFNTIQDVKLILSEEFVNLFPSMSKLLNKAYKIEFTLNGNQRFRQYIWTSNDGETCGWLCKLEHCIPQGRGIIPEHILLSQTVGGIIDYWVDDASKEQGSLIDANVFTFSLTDSTKGVGGLTNGSNEECQSVAIDAFDPSLFLTFALEANGNTTFYNCQTKEVFVYLHDDYSPFDITPCKDADPSCSAIYRYDKVHTFIDYVETLADQWLQIIQLKNKSNL